MRGSPAPWRTPSTRAAAQLAVRGAGGEARVSHHIVRVDSASPCWIQVVFFRTSGEAAVTRGAAARTGGA